MRDNVDRYQIEVIGQIRESHRFRSLPDTQYATTSVPLVDTLRNSVMHLDEEKIKNFRFGPDFGVLPGQDVGPPAHFTPRELHDIPHVYSYKQNPNVHVVTDKDGNATTVNTMKTKQHINHSLPLDAETVPDRVPPDTDLEPEEMQPRRIRGYIQRIREALETRPILSKRYIKALLNYADNDTRYAWAYCGYVFRSGPWRDALIKFGVDPRKDPQYRFYQCFTFKIDKNRFTDDGVKQKWQHYGRRGLGKLRDGRKNYEFDGQHVVTDGKVFQLCDITDPLLKSIINTSVVRSEFSQIDGWLHNGTVAKIRTIMKHKLDLCIEGKVPDDDLYQRLITFPDYIPSGHAGTQHWRELVATDGRGPPTMEEQLLSETLRTIAGMAKEGRRAKSNQAYLAEEGSNASDDDVEEGSDEGTENEDADEGEASVGEDEE